MPSAYDLAQTLTGSHEGDAAVRDYLTTGGQNLDPRTTAWCAAFVNASLARSGQQGTGSNMARSFMNYGTAVDTPQRGDIAVFSRGDPNGSYGHVGFFESYGPDGRIRVLGGNQSDAVTRSSYDPSRLLGFRRPGTNGEINAPVTNAEQQPQGLLPPQQMPQTAEAAYTFNPQPVETASPVILEFPVEDFRSFKNKLKSRRSPEAEQILAKIRSY